MVQFWSTSEDGVSPQWSQATLVMPAVSIGNVGQLAVDLLINTLKLERVGVLESQFVLPAIGNNAYDTDTEPAGQMAVEVELYGSKGGEVYTLQQRSPVAAGCQRRFAEDFMEWVKQCGFRQVLVLASIDSAFRKDQQILGPQLRFVCPGGSDAKCEGMGLQELAADEGSDGIAESKRRSPPWPLLQASKDKAVPLTAFCMFASEGDNIPDALHMASATAQYLSLVPESQQASFQWKPPQSWCNLYGPPSTAPMY